MLKNRKIIGLSAAILLTITPYNTEAKTCAWNTFWKTMSGVAIGLPFGALRYGSHILTRSTAGRIWGESNAFVLRKPLALAIGTVMWITLNSILEVSRAGLAEKIEQNLDDARENIYLTDAIARYMDWMVGLSSIAAFECYGGTKEMVTALQQLFIPQDDTLSATRTE